MTQGRTSGRSTVRRLRTGPCRTVLEAALSGSPEIARLRRALAATRGPDGRPGRLRPPARLARVMDEHARLLHEYEAAGGLTYENRVRSTLRDLGLGDETFDRTLDTLSGGQTKLVGLARLVVGQPDVLLLDEPDNHLDLAGKSVSRRADPRLQRRGGDRLARPLSARRGGAIRSRSWKMGRSRSTPATTRPTPSNKQLAALRQQQLYQAQQKRINAD